MPIDEALWYRSFGPPIEVLNLEALEVDFRPPGAVRVRMIAAPINPSDLIPITGGVQPSGPSSPRSPVMKASAG